MRRPLIAGNWKMNSNRAESLELARGIADSEIPDGVDVLVCPAFVYLTSVHSELARSTVKLGAQDAYNEANGAFTGEISCEMLTDVGCSFAILGHSERRHVMGETDAQINLKLNSTLKAGLTPILCVGELLEEREFGKTMEVIRSQFDGATDGLSAELLSKVVIAYEPVWAIGTGKTASPEQAQEIHADLRNLIASRYNPGIAEDVRILYGGSVKPANAAELLSQHDIDGALVGGASLNADSFCKIIAAAKS